MYANEALYTGDTDFYSSATAITNIEYEEARQNKLRRIKILQPNQVATITNEFASLMKDE